MTRGRLIVDARNLGPVLFVQVEVVGARVGWSSNLSRGVIALASLDLALVLTDGVSQRGKEETIDKAESPSRKGNSV